MTGEEQLCAICGTLKVICRWCNCRYCAKCEAMHLYHCSRGQKGTNQVSKFQRNDYVVVTTESENERCHHAGGTVIGVTSDSKSTVNRVRLDRPSLNKFVFDFKDYELRRME